MRASARQRLVLEQAAEVEGSSTTEFILRHAVAHAEQVLVDRRDFALAPEAWDSFAALLERPEADKPRLRALLSEPTALEE